MLFWSIMGTFLFVMGVCAAVDYIIENKWHHYICPPKEPEPLDREISDEIDLAERRAPTEDNLD